MKTKGVKKMGTKLSTIVEKGVTMYEICLLEILNCWIVLAVYSIIQHFDSNLRVKLKLKLWELHHLFQF